MCTKHRPKPENLGDITKVSMALIDWGRVCVCVCVCVCMRVCAYICVCVHVFGWVCVPFHFRTKEVSMVDVCVIAGGILEYIGPLQTSKQSNWSRKMDCFSLEDN